MTEAAEMELSHGRSFYFTPRSLKFTLLDGKDIRDGKLDNLDLLVVPVRVGKSK